MNLLALLGWNPGTEQEIFSMEELISLFSLERVNKSGARFDPVKAKWFNHQYLQQKSNAEVAQCYLKLLREKGISDSPLRVEQIVALMKERVNFVQEIWEKSSFFYEEPAVYDSASVQKFWKEETPAIMQEVLLLLAKLDAFTCQSIEEALVAFIQERGYGMGKVMNAIRLSLIGVANGPGVAEIAEILGKESALARIRKAVAEIAAR